ncbi:hypothetical protein [uncultured Lacinutrix sp.]|uniref:hypothetical protein n=1 Tax=uncultured Lacinutrix sp. TaxID=574032 RepID=UPI0026260370|nr:hypothetical protein [uncultured Lacinutrix sp.]
MKSLFTLFFISCSLLSNYAQQDKTEKKILSGKIIATKDGLSLNNSIELTKGMSMDFKFDGKSLDVSIGTKLYEDIELSAGFAIKPLGETCFYMNLSDGIDLGAFQLKTTRGTASEAVLNTNFNTSIDLGTEFCVNWLDNKAMKLKPLVGNPQNLISVPKTLKTLFSFLHNIKFNSEFQLEASYTGEAEALIPSNTSRIPLNTYCLDWEKEIPLENTVYEISKESVNIDLSFIEEAFVLNKDVIQNEIWLQKFKANPSEIYVSKVGLFKEKKFSLKYGLITFLSDVDIYVFENEESFIKFKSEMFGDVIDVSEFITHIRLKNGEVILSFLDKITLDKLKALDLLGFKYINKILE